MSDYKKSTFKDERLSTIKNKIYAEIYILVAVVIVISAIVKLYVYNTGVESIVTELVILVTSSIYYLYRSTKLGVVSAEIEMHDRTSKWSRQKKNLVLSVILGIGIALFFGINSAVRYADGVNQSITYFLLTTFVSLLIYLPFFLIFLVAGNEVLKTKSDQSINKMLDEDEYGDRDEKY